MVRVENPEDGPVDLEAALEALADDDLEALRSMLGERWWLSHLRLGHFRNPAGDRVFSTYGIWKALNHGVIDTLEPKEDGAYKLDRPTITIDGEEWTRMTDEEVLAYYAEKDDTGGMGFLVSASDVATEER